MASENDGRINPDQVYRPRDAARFFGYRSTQLYEHIARGDIPPPVPLSDSGIAVGWYGRTILEHQANRQAVAEREAASRREAREAAGRSQASPSAKAAAPAKRRAGPSRRR